MGVPELVVAAGLLPPPPPHAAKKIQTKEVVALRDVRDMNCAYCHSQLPENVDVVVITVANVHR
jgi:hypothetical protein